MQFPDYTYQKFGEKLSSEIRSHSWGCYKDKNKLVKNIDSFDTGRKCNIYKSFRRRLGRLLNILCVFSLLPVSIENGRDSKKITSNKF